ncbi:MAG: hypothetical protein ACJAT6_001285 [Akkermansiaceae bacterium]|jgi:hypothetical protein|tara:strand:+ start:1474 stop:1665 length:192 start_codon:yes stop_codon:yes gene_type:complete
MRASDLTEGLLVKQLDLVAGPRCFAEEFEAGFKRRIIGEAPDTNSIGEFVPSILFLQLNQHLF